MTDPVGSVGRMGTLTPTLGGKLRIWLGVDLSQVKVIGVKPGRRISRHVKLGNGSGNHRTRLGILNTLNSGGCVLPERERERERESERFRERERARAREREREREIERERGR